MYPSSNSDDSSTEDLEFEELWERVTRLVPFAGMEDKLFWRRLEARRAGLSRLEGDPAGEGPGSGELLLTLREFEARLRTKLAVRLALRGDPGRNPSKVA